MRFRKKRFRPSDHVTVRPIAGGYPLPAGLPAGATVKVLAIDIGSVDVEYAGRSFSVSLPCIDSGREYELNHTWRDETDPQVIRAHQQNTARRRPESLRPPST